MTNLDQPRPPNKRWSALRIILTLVISLIAVVVCSGIGIAISNSVANQPDDPTVGATVACEGFVKDALKSPSSADFSNETVHGPVAGHPSRYIVVGAVDAENSFGAKLRSNFGCTAEKRSDGNWYLVDMTGLT